MMAKMECDDCGACCRSMIIEIYHVDVVREPRLLDVAEPMRIGVDGQIPDDPWEREYLLAAGGGSPCPFHVGLCEIYPTRPNCCVAFEAGGWQCQLARLEAGLSPLGRDAWPDDPAERNALVSPPDGV